MIETITRNKKSGTKKKVPPRFLAPVILNEAVSTMDICKQQVSHSMMVKRGMKIVPSVECSDHEPFQK